MCPNRSPVYDWFDREVFPRTCLSQLRDGWNTYVQRRRQPSGVGGLLQLFKPSLGDDVSDSVSRSIEQLDKDWFFLNLLMMSLEIQHPRIRLKLEGWARLWVPNGVEDVGDEIRKHLSSCVRRSEYYEPQKLVKLIGDCRMKTDCLSMEKIRQVLSGVLRCGCDVIDIYLGRSYICLVMEGLMLIKELGGGGSLEKQLSACRAELKFFSSYHEKGQDNVVISGSRRI